MLADVGATLCGRTCNMCYRWAISWFGHLTVISTVPLCKNNFHIWTAVNHAVPIVYGIRHQSNNCNVHRLQDWCGRKVSEIGITSSLLRQNDRHFIDEKIRQWKLLYFDSNFSEVFPEGLNHNKSAQNQVMAWRRTGGELKLPTQTALRLHDNIIWIRSSWWCDSRFVFYYPSEIVR